MPNAEDVKELREKTGAGILDCKDALTQTDTVEEAVEYLQKKGAEMADEISDHTAAEGTVKVAADSSSNDVVLLEVNCETDFTARSDKFQAFAEKAAKQAVDNQTETVDALRDIEIVSETVGDLEQTLTADFGENIKIRRIKYIESQDGTIETYLHGNSIGSVAVVDTPNTEGLAADIAKQVAAMNPSFISPGDAPKEEVAKMEEVFKGQMVEQGKPEHIIPKIVEGKIKKWKKENALLTQPYIRNTDLTVQEWIGQRDDEPEILKFARFEVGEGIETEEENFAEEVMEQVSET